MELKITHRVPTIREYNELRQSVEWPILDERLVDIGLANSLCAVVVQTETGLTVGMGRVVGDGAIYLHIQDVIVRPEFQGHGVGKLIMEALLGYVASTGGKNTNIGLMSSKGREGFYTKFGFIERPSDKFGSGMIKIKE